MIISDIITCKEKQLPIVFAAESLSPLPIKIEARGAPPALINAAKAETINIIGIQTPMPVSAKSPSTFIWPMYILSTMLYSIFISCAVMVGTASENSSFPTGAVLRKVLSFFIIYTFFIVFLCFYGILSITQKVFL